MSSHPSRAKARRQLRAERAADVVSFTAGFRSNIAQIVVGAKTLQIMMRSLFLALSLAGSVHATTPEPPAVVLKLELPTLDGKQFKLAEQRGQWVVVNYWATWCGPCIKEMPELDELDRARKDVVVIGLAFEETTPEDLKEFLKSHPVSYPIALVDTYAPPDTFSVPKGLPTTHVIAPDGKLAKSFLGPVSRADIERLIDSPAGVAKAK